MFQRKSDDSLQPIEWKCTLLTTATDPLYDKLIGILGQLSITYKDFWLLFWEYNLWLEAAFPFPYHLVWRGRYWSFDVLTGYKGDWYSRFWLRQSRQTIYVREFSFRTPLTVPESNYKEYFRQFLHKGRQEDCDWKVDDTDLVSYKNQHRIYWVIKHVPVLCSGRYGHIRTVKVKTASGQKKSGVILFLLMTLNFSYSCCDFR